MQLVFETTRNLGTGNQPSAIHSADNYVQVFHTLSGKINVMSAETPLGDWGGLFGSPYLVCRDEAVQYLKLKYLSGTNLWAVWRNKAETSDEGYVAGYDRHRIAVFTLFQNVSKYLASGSLEFSQNNPVAQLMLELKNPNQEVSAEDDAVVIPGSAVSLYFRAGDSDRYPLGKYFIDRNQMSVTGGSTSVEARNAIGKLLKDQTFDEDNSYALSDFELVLAAMLESAGVTEDKRVIYDSANTIGMEFPEDMTILDGLHTIMDAVSDGSLGGWAIRESMDGKIVVGPLQWTGHDQPSSYDFQRGTDVFSRDVARDDAESYSRVCVKTTTESVYRDIEGRFPLPRKKTLHVTAAEGTTTDDLEQQADMLAGRLSQVGVIETFTGPIRPHIQPGDSATIIDYSSNYVHYYYDTAKLIPLTDSFSATETFDMAQPAGEFILLDIIAEADNSVKSGTISLVGVITTVRHIFGERGFSTEFTVDSGGQVGKAQIGDFISKIAGQKASPGGVTRLY